MNCRLRSIAATGLAALTFAAVGRADNWPNWRGPTYDGICTEKGLPTKWSETENIAWKLKMPGSGGSTPVVWNDKIFLTSEDGKSVELLCLATSGKILWQHILGAGGGTYMRGEGNDASPSPSTDGEHVYTFTGHGDLACCDLDGNVVWNFNAQERYGVFEIWHGMHTTPLLYGDRLYIQLLHAKGAWVIALDKLTGKDVWKVKRETDAENESKQSYASVVPWHKGNESYIICHGGDYTTAHRLDDGQEIWRLGGLNPKEHYNGYLRFVASPLATADLIVVPTAKNESVVGLKPNAHGFVTVGDPMEQWRLPKKTPDVPSPLAYGGLVYLYRENGDLLCLDEATGAEVYSKGRTHEGRHRASPVYADGLIYLGARDGTVTVVKAGRKYEQVAQNRLTDTLTASPVISNGRIYLRGWDYLYAIGTPVR
jgi:outer membrane protein assembly factor BamB